MFLKIFLKKLVSSVLVAVMLLGNFSWSQPVVNNYLRAPSNESVGRERLVGELKDKSVTEGPYKNGSDPVYGKTLWKDEAGLYTFTKALTFDGRFLSHLMHLQNAEVLTPEILVEAIAYFVQFDKNINSKEDLDELFKLAKILIQQIDSLVQVENIAYSYDDEFYFQALRSSLYLAVKLYEKEKYNKKIINSVQGKSIQAKIIQTEELNIPKTISIGVNVTEMTKSAVLNRKHELEGNLKKNKQKGFPELSEMDEKEFELMKKIFAKIIGHKNTEAAKNLKEILDTSFGYLKAETILNLLLEGKIDDLNKIKPDERKKIYEAIFINGKIWKSPSGKMDTLLNFITLNSGLREIYFGKPGGTEVEIYFAATNEQFADIVIAQKERILGEPLKPEEKVKLKELFSSGMIGGSNLPYLTLDGKMGSIIVINLGVDGFGKVLSSLFHEMAHNLLINEKALRAGKNIDVKFIDEGIAEDFSIFALNALRAAYDGESAFSVLSARRQYRVLREKAILNDEYRYGFLLIETIRTRLGMNKFHKLIPEIIRAVKGESSVMELSVIVDREEKKPSSTNLAEGSPVDLDVTKAKTFEELVTLINQTNLIPPENRKKLIDLIDKVRKDKLDLPEDDDTGIIGLKAKVQELIKEDFLKVIEKITFDPVAGEMKFVRPSTETIVEKIFFLDTMKEFKNVRKIKFTDYNLNPNIGIMDTNLPIYVYTLLSEDGKFLGIQVGRENFPRSREKINKDVDKIIKSYADSIRKGEKTFINMGEDEVIIFINYLIIKEKEELLKIELTSSVLESHKTIDWVLEQLSLELGVSPEILKKVYAKALERSREERENLERQENSYFGPYLLKEDLDMLVRRSQALQPDNLTENTNDPRKLWENEEGLHNFMQLLLSDKASYVKHLDVLKNEKVSYGDVIRAVGYFVQFNEGNVTDKNLDKLFEQADRLLSQINGLILVHKDHYGYLDKVDWIHGIRPLLDKLIKIYNSEENKQQFIARVKQAPISIRTVAQSVSRKKDDRADIFISELSKLKSEDFTTYHRMLKIIGSVTGLKGIEGEHFLDIRGTLSPSDEKRILNELRSKLNMVLNSNKDELLKLILQHELNSEAYVPIIDSLLDLLKTTNVQVESNVFGSDIKLQLFKWADLYTELFGMGFKTSGNHGQSYVNGRENDIMTWKEAEQALRTASLYQESSIITAAVNNGWLESIKGTIFYRPTEKGWSEFFRRAREMESGAKMNLIVPPFGTGLEEIIFFFAINIALNYNIIIARYPSLIRQFNTFVNGFFGQADRIISGIAPVAPIPAGVDIQGYKGRSALGSSL